MKTDEAGMSDECTCTEGMDLKLQFAGKKTILKETQVHVDKSIGKNSAYTFSDKIKGKEITDDEEPLSLNNFTFKQLLLVFFGFAFLTQISGFSMNSQHNRLTSWTGKCVSL